MCGYFSIDRERVIAWYTVFQLPCVQASVTDVTVYKTLKLQEGNSLT